jgi:hypothetical protein
LTLLARKSENETKLADEASYADFRTFLSVRQTSQAINRTLVVPLVAGSMHALSTYRTSMSTPAISKSGKRGAKQKAATQ